MRNNDGFDDHTGGPDRPRDGRVSAETAADVALLEAEFASIEASRARVIGALARVRARGDGEAAVGMPIEQHLAWTTRQRPGTVHGFATVVDVIDDLPHVRTSLDAGEVSFEQVKAVAYTVARATRDERAGVDTVLATTNWSGWDPDHLEFEIGRVLNGLRDPADLAAKADRRRRTQFLRLQPTLDGQGLDGHFRYWDLDAAQVDAILHASAGTPTTEADDGLDATRRQRSLAQGLLDILTFWQHWSTGRGTTDPDAAAAGPELPQRPAAQILLVVDEHDQTPGDTATVWTNTPRLRPIITREQLDHLDAKTIAVRVDDDGRPVSIDGRKGHATGDPDGLSWGSWQILVTVRDGGCRTPGCNAPARWTELHHIIHQANHGPDRDDNLLALCRRCHLRVMHRWTWTARLEPDGTAHFKRGGQTIATTHPRRRKRLRRLPPTGPPTAATNDPGDPPRDPFGDPLPF